MSRGPFRGTPRRCLHQRLGPPWHPSGPTGAERRASSTADGSHGSRPTGPSATSPQLTDEQRKLVLLTIADARAAYRRRNRYKHHDLLVKDLLSVDGWELMRLDRSRPDSPPTSAAEMVRWSRSRGMKYRLRGAALYVLQGRWAEWAFR